MSFAIAHPSYFMHHLRPLQTLVAIALLIMVTGVSYVGTKSYNDFVADCPNCRSFVP